MFLRIFLKYVNSETMSKKTRLRVMRYSFIWLTSTKVAHPIALNNFTNSAFGLLSIALRKDVQSLRLVTTGSLEYHFENTRISNYELNDLYFTIFVKNIGKILEAIFYSKLASGCGQSKGCLLEFERLLWRCCVLGIETPALNQFLNFQLMLVTIEFQSPFNCKKKF